MMIRHGGLLGVTPAIHMALRCREARMAARVGWALRMAVVVVMLVPAVASAATVSTRELYGSDFGPWSVYEAAAGESNRLVVDTRQDQAGVIRFADTRAPLRALPACRTDPAGRSQALCPQGPARIDLGDRSDWASITAPTVSYSLQLMAGEGDDWVFADPGASVAVEGGAGDDRLRLGDHALLATVRGGTGRDVIYGGLSGVDLGGGPDDDLILNQGIVGPPGAVGDEGNDVLRLRYVPPSSYDAGAGGRSGDDVLFVAPADVPVESNIPDGLISWYLGGNDGRDVLIGGAGPDGLSGGAGDDVLISSDGRPEWVTCDDGLDVAYADRDDRLVGCEIKRTLPPARVTQLARALDRQVNLPGASSLAVRRFTHHLLHQLERGGR